MERQDDDERGSARKRVWTKHGVVRMKMSVQSGARLSELVRILFGVGMKHSPRLTLRKQSRLGDVLLSHEKCPSSVPNGSRPSLAAFSDSAQARLCLGLIALDELPPRNVSG